MPIVYDNDVDRGLLRASFSGAVSPAELLAWYGELRAQPDFRDDLKEIAHAGSRPEPPGLARTAGAAHSVVALGSSGLPSDPHQAPPQE